MTKKFLLLIAAVAALAIAGCGDDDDDGGGGDAAADTKTVTLEASEPSADKVELTAPEEVEAGVVRLELKNNGKATHDAQLIRIEGDHTTAEATKVFQETGEGKPIPDWFLGAGGLGTTKPGQTRTATQVLTPGKYIVFDTENAGEDGPPNFSRGGMAEIEVTGEAGGELPASAGPRVRAADYSFETFSLKAGNNEIVFENAGKQPHHIVAAPLNEGATLGDVKKALQEDEEEEGGGPPPFDEKASDSTAVLDGNQTQITQLNLKAGRYVLMCFISDRQGGPPHVAKGMITEATVR